MKTFREFQDRVILYERQYGLAFRASMERALSDFAADVREQCAGIADDFGAVAGNDSSGQMAHIIAQAIRSVRVP